MRFWIGYLILGYVAIDEPSDCLPFIGILLIASYLYDMLAKQRDFIKYKAVVEDYIATNYPEEYLRFPYATKVEIYIRDVKRAQNIFTDMAKNRNPKEVVKASCNKVNTK